MDERFPHWPEWLFVALCILGGSTPAVLGLAVWVTVVLVPIGMLLGIGLWIVLLVAYAWIMESRKQP